MGRQVNVQPILDGLPLRNRHEDHSWPDSLPRGLPQEGFVDPRWQDYAFVLRVVDELPVESLRPPPRLLPHVTAIDNDRIPTKRHPFPPIRWPVIRPMPELPTRTWQR